MPAGWATKIRRSYLAAYSSFEHVQDMLCLMSNLLPQAAFAWVVERQTNMSTTLSLQERPLQPFVASQKTRKPPAPLYAANSSFLTRRLFAPV